MLVPLRQQYCQRGCVSNCRFHSTSCEEMCTTEAAAPKPRRPPWPPRSFSGRWMARTNSRSQSCASSSAWRTCGSCAIVLGFCTGRVGPSIKDVYETFGSFTPSSPLIPYSMQPISSVHPQKRHSYPQVYTLFMESLKGL